MLRLLILLLPLGLFAHSSQKTILISSVQVSSYRGSRGPAVDEETALQVRRGAGMALESRGLTVIEGASPNPDMVLSIQLVRRELLQPAEPLEPALCGDLEEPEPVRGSLTLSAALKDRAGNVLWTQEESRPYHCNVPRFEVWNLVLFVLDKAPI